MGGTANDTFNALVVQDNNAASKNTVENIDQLDGGAGTDTLNATISDADAAPVLKSIENINVRFASANKLDLTNATGVTQVTVANSTAAGTVAGVGAVATIAVKNQNQDATFTGNTATTLNLGLDTVGTKAIANTVTLDNKATTLNVTANNAYVTTVGTNGVTTLSVAATGANKLTMPSAATAATVTGAGSLELATAFTTLKTLDASANTGGVTATVDDKAVTVTGGAGADKITYTAAIAATAKVDLGAGNDTLTLGGASLKGAVVNGGDGVDTLAVTAAAQLDTDSKAIYTGFEVLQVSANDAVAGAQSFDPTLVAGITSYKVAASTEAVELKNLAAAPTVTVIGNAADLTLTLKDATGAADSATVTLDNGAVSKAGTKIDGVVVTKLTATGVETLNIHSNGTVSTETGLVGIANSVTLATLTTSKVVIDGSQAVSFTTGAHTATLTVDATAATGAVTVDAALATGLVNVNGGAGNDVIKGGTIGGLIYGGAGGDTVTLGVAGSADSLVYKAASDSLLAVKADGTLNVAKLDAVTNFTTTADKIDLTSLGFTANTQKVVLEKTAAAGDAALWALATSADFYKDASAIVRGVVAVSNGTDTYVFADANKDGVFNAANDLVIKLAGIATGAGIDQADVIFG